MIVDIVYNELNRWRDKQDSDQEKICAIKGALRKALTKFKYLWDDQLSTGIYKKNEINLLFNSLSEEFLTLAIETESILRDDAITDYLRKISTNFRKASRTPHVFGGYFQNPVPDEIKDNLLIVETIFEKLKY